jgi:demethylmenaquinone methyltransferase/2-methoxy-6-polyprenyl-1,4-benzoquinol methylase
MTETVSFGYEQVSPEEKTRRVRGVFSSVASKYDIMNDAMSGGMHRLWKDQFVRRVKPRAGEDILDMAGGTGDIAFRMEKAGANITVSDINPDMLAVGMERAVERGIDTLVWSEQNAETLSFPRPAFRCLHHRLSASGTSPTFPAALREAHRVSCAMAGAFSASNFRPSNGQGCPKVYDVYSHHLLPKMGKVIAGDEDSYRYLAESIRKFPPCRPSNG